MLRIVKSLLTIVAVAAIAVGATGAVFSDEALVADNTFSAGTLDLKVNGQDSLTQSYMITNLHPGSWDAAGQVMIKNEGTLKGHAWLEVVNVRNYENGVNGPEIAAGDTTPGADEGELGQFARLSIERNRAPWGVRYGMTQTLDSAPGVRVDLEDLDPGTDLPVFIYGVWVSGNDNIAQGDSVTFDIIFHLDQV